MPAVSSRYTPSASTSIVTGSYRSNLSPSPSLDKPYFRSTSGTYVTSSIRSTIGDRTTEYRSRFSDIDGKRERKSSIVEYSRNSRAPSVTDSDSGISSRYRSERSESRSRDISTTRSESGRTAISDPVTRTPKRNVISTAALAMSTAELYNKYSPANYIPLTQRLQQQQLQNQNNYGEFSRSKSISNDIGRPPAPDARALRKARNSTASGTISERPEGRRSYKESSPTPSYTKRNSMSNGIKDTNGNEVIPSVSDIRKRFDSKMTVTKLPTNESKYSAKAAVDQYLSQLKSCENGTTTGYTKILPKDDKPVPVHLPSVDKNGINHKWEIGSSSSRSNSNSDISLSKTSSEPVSLAKPIVEKNNDMTVSLTAKLPSDRLANIKSQLDPNNPIGKILEKSTVIQVENGDADPKERKRLTRISPEVTVTIRRESLKNDIENQIKTPKHTSNFASYIQISQPVASGTSSPKSTKQVELNNVPNEEETQVETPKAKNSLKYIDSEEDNRSLLDNEVESPTGTGFENKTFEHENFLKKRNEDQDFKETKDIQNGHDDAEAKPMETSTESTISEPTEDLSPDVPSSRRKIDYDEIRAELAGGKSTSTSVRRSIERSEALDRDRNDTKTCVFSSFQTWLNEHYYGKRDAGFRSTEALELLTHPKVPKGNSAKSLITKNITGLNGLRNIGNTCFMNSVLQCLSNTRPLLEYIVRDDQYETEINTTLSCMKGALIKAFASVIRALWAPGERDSVVNTTSLKSQVQRFAPRFMGYSQQDAQEFLRYLLEGLHEDVNRVTVKPKPILTEIDDTLSDTAKAAEAWSRYLRCEDSHVSDIFVGQLKSTLRCTHCHNDSVTFDPFWDLSLPIPSRTGTLKLQQCLQHFTKEEEMDGDEKPTCSKCGVRRKCLKWFTVQKFPQVLVLHLKRFSPLERFRGKLSCQVECPLTGLDMSAYAAAPGCAPAVYNLVAVSNHSGTTYSGHYTAYCKHPYTGDWHEYNDSRVTPMKARDVVTSEAYVLFYELQRS